MKVMQRHFKHLRQPGVIIPSEQFTFILSATGTLASEAAEW